MYQDRSAFNKSEKTAEEYLLGKEVKEGDLTDIKEGEADSKCSRLAKGIQKSD